MGTENGSIVWTIEFCLLSFIEHIFKTLLYVELKHVMKKMRSESTLFIFSCYICLYEIRYHYCRQHPQGKSGNDYF